MASCDVPPVFTDREVKLIGQSLPDTVDPRRRELLPQVLREWCRNELREHLSRESAATIRERVERMKAVADHARGLLQALEALDDRDRAAIAGQMLPRDLWLSPKGGEIIRGLTHLIREENSFLTELAAAAPAAWKQGRGAPQNIKAYLFIRMPRQFSSGSQKRKPREKWVAIPLRKLDHSGSSSQPSGPWFLAKAKDCPTE